MIFKRTEPDLHVVSDEDIDHLAKGMEDEVRDLIKQQPPERTMPDYVTHDPDVDYVGKLTSEALVMTYEASAKQIEAMGTGLLEAMRECRSSAAGMVKELERVEQETEEAVKQCLAAAEVYRGQAKELFEQIQNRAILAAKVRETAAAMVEDLKK
jgi:hypothetical protein